LSRLRAGRIIFTSTMMVFGAGEEPKSEDSLTAPTTAYGMSKLLAEETLRAWQRERPERRVTVIRPAVVFGRGEEGNYTRLYYALKRHRFAYIGRRTTIKSCVYIKDAIRFLLFVLERPGSFAVYNLAAREEPTIEEICDAFGRVCGVSTRIPTVPYTIALGLGYAGELLGRFGVSTALHHRRIEKLFYSNRILASAAIEAGFEFRFGLEDALVDWRAECAPRDLY
jgi:nucleoside-diphosphate-sugar epimerase